MSSPEATPSPGTPVIQGRRIAFPVVVRRASAGSATYLVPSARARALLPGPELEIAEPLPGRALLSLAIIDYVDNDLGDYDEVSVALFVRPRGASKGLPYVGTVVDLLKGRLGTHILHLPVNQSFTCEAGATIWGFPKTVQQIDFVTTDDRATCRLVHDGVHALTLSLPRGGDKAMPEKTLTNFTYIEGVAHTNRFTSRAEGFSARGGGGVELELGGGPIADQLRSLGLPKRPLMATWMEHMQASFGPSTKL